MRTADNLLETTPCPGCGETGIHPYRLENFQFPDSEPMKLGHNICPKCQLRFTSPRLNDEGLSLLYGEHYEEKTVSGIYNVHDEVSVHEYDSFEGYLTERLPDGGRVLDIGCGVGLLLERMRNIENIEPVGLEFSTYAAEAARNRGFEIIEGMIQNAGIPEESYDAATILYVLEHVPNPLEVLQSAAKVLKPGGCLLLSVPNYRYLRLIGDNPLAIALRGEKASLHPQEHLLNYTPDSISRLVEKAGFEVLDTQMARPLNAGPAYIQVAKKLLYGGVKLAQMAGYQIGGIHLICRKKGA